MKKALLVAVALLASACGPGGDDSLPVCDDELCTLDDSENPGFFLTVVHAPDKDIPTFFSFAEPDDPVSSDAWDLGFARTSITVNGGVSGDAGIEVALLEGKSLIELEPSDVPSEGWFSDEDLELAFERDDKWYVYDIGRHVVEVRPRVYFVRSADGLVWALELISYYDYTGAARYPTFRWLELSE